MSMTDNHIKEDLSFAYVRAVSAKAGVNLSRHEKDYGIDGTLELVQTRGKKRYVNSGYKLDFQLKASSTQCKVDSDNIVFDLEAKTYNDLIERGKQLRATPCILLLYCLPNDENLWLEISEQHLVMKKCCYWTHFGGDISDNTDSKRIRIPRTQIFTPNSLLNLFEKVKNGELQ